MNGSEPCSKRTRTNDILLVEDLEAETLARHVDRIRVGLGNRGDLRIMRQCTEIGIAPSAGIVLLLIRELETLKRAFDAGKRAPSHHQVCASFEEIAYVAVAGLVLSAEEPAPSIQPAPEPSDDPSSRAAGDNSNACPEPDPAAADREPAFADAIRIALNQDGDDSLEPQGGLGQGHLVGLRRNGTPAMPRVARLDER